uniref:Carbohydrate deacetylase n=1 Tax=Macrostomum lignano TaxID=282301 RepID=A0A1I8G0T2_9PLAT
MVTGSACRSAELRSFFASRPTPGLHLNLTEGRPVCPPGQVPSLVNPDTGRFLGKLGFRAALSAGQVSRSDILAEAGAQFARFAELFDGRPAGHADGHQHAHSLPGLAASAFAEAAAAAGVHRVRVPAECRLPWLDVGDEDNNKTVETDGEAQSQRRRFLTDVSNDAAIAAKQEFASAGLTWPGAFMGLSSMGAEMRLDRVARQLARQLSPALIKLRSMSDEPAELWCEWMVHPGEPCLPGEPGCGGDPVDEFACSSERRHEADFLASEEFAHFLMRPFDCEAFVAELPSDIAASEAVRLRLSSFHDMPLVTQPL